MIFFREGGSEGAWCQIRGAMLDLDNNITQKYNKDNLLKQNLK